MVWGATALVLSEFKELVYVNQFLPLPVQDVTKSLLEYPWNCLEQTVSRGYATIATNADVAPTINHLRSLQSFDGFFSAWGSPKAPASGPCDIDAETLAEYLLPLVKKG